MVVLYNDGVCAFCNNNLIPNCFHNLKIRIIFLLRSPASPICTNLYELEPQENGLFKFSFRALSTPKIASMWNLVKAGRLFFAVCLIGLAGQQFYYADFRPVFVPPWPGR